MVKRSSDNTLPREALLEAEMDGSFTTDKPEAEYALNCIVSDVRDMQETADIVEIRLDAFMQTHMLAGIDERGLDPDTALYLAVNKGFVSIEELECPDKRILAWYAGLDEADPSLETLYENFLTHPDFDLRPYLSNLMDNSGVAYFSGEQVSEVALAGLERAFAMYDLDANLVHYYSHYSGSDRINLKLLDGNNGLVVLSLGVNTNGMVFKFEVFEEAMKLSFCRAALESGRLLDVSPVVYQFPELDAAF